MNKLIRAGLWLLCSGICAPSWADLDQRTKLEIRVICEQLFADYAVYLDHLDADGFADTFTPDAPFPGTDPSGGRERLRQYIRDHGTQAHLIMFTSTEINVLSETGASGLAYGVILNGNRELSEAGGAINGANKVPIQMAGITAATEYYADFRLTDEGWKISNMDRKGVFRGPGYVQ